MAIESFDELLRQLRSRPEWREQLRVAVLTEELLALPGQVGALTEQVSALTERMNGLVERMDALTERMDGLVERMDGLVERMDGLVERMDGLVVRMDALTVRMDALTVRMDALTERMDALTERMDGLVVRMDALTERMDGLVVRMDALTERMDALVVAQDRTEATLTGLVDQLSVVGHRVDRAIGFLVEQQYREKAHAYFQTIARRIHVLSADELEDLLDPAIEAGTLSELQAREVRWADAVIRARRDGQEVFLVVEASVVVDAEDVRRAEYRASLVSKLGAPALAVVAGDNVLGEAAIAARERGLWLVTDGRVDAPNAA